MQTTIFSVANKAHLDACTNPPPPPHLSSTLMMSLVNYTKKTGSSSPSPLTHEHGLVPCYKHSSPMPTSVNRNLGAPHTPTINTTDPIPTPCMSAPPNHHAHLGSSYQPTSNGANLPQPHGKHSMATPTLHPNQAYIQFNSLDSAFERHTTHYFVMLPVRSNFIPQPLHLTSILSSLWKIHTQ